MTKKKPKFIIIDGNALVHRSFHALPPTMTTKDGQMVNAVYGFATALFKAIREFKPDYVALTMDKKGPTFRHKMFKEYKAKRIKAPHELYMQIPKVKELARVFNIPVYELSGYEADDLIGALSVKVNGEVEKIILTGDMDTLQLVNEHTKVVTMSRGITESFIYDTEMVKKRYGLRPDQIIDYKAIRGDPSDNIPGVRGIGDKGAVALLQTFGTLENIYDNLARETKKITEGFKPRTRELLSQYKKDAFLSQKLATIKTDVKFTFNLAEAKFADYDKAKVYKFLGDMEFKSLLPRVQAMFDEQQEEAGQSVSVDKFARNKKKFKYLLIEDNKQFKKFFKELNKQSGFTFDTETSSFDPFSAQLLGISFSWKKGEAYYVCFKNRHVLNSTSGSEKPNLFNYQDKLKTKTKNKSAKIDPWLKSLQTVFKNSTIGKRAHNAKFDIRVMRHQGIDIQGLDFDTMIASYLLNPGSRQHNLDAVTFSELGFEKISKTDLLGRGKDKITFSKVATEKLMLYSCEDADFTNRLVKKLKPLLKKKKLNSLFTKIELPLVPVLGKMEDNGVKLDKAFLAKMGKDIDKKIKILEKKIYKQAGAKFNIKSPKQLQVIIFERLEIPSDRIKKTKTGISTAADELAKIVDLHPIVALIQEYRELSKLSSTYINALPKLVNKKTKRLHTSFNQSVTATGRLSSSDPNLQNIPIRTSAGKEIRKAFIAEKDFELLSLDYSQIELRLAAHMSNDKKMIKAFTHGADIHISTSAEINQVSPEAVTKKMRREAKAVNFGILYGQGPHGLAQTAGIPYWRAKEFIENYFNVYKGVKKFIDTCINDARSKGYAETMFQRRRYLPELNSSVAMVRKAAERMAINTPLQGTAADMIKVAMIKIAKAIKDPDVRMIMQVHDELIFEIKKDKVAKFAVKIKKIMEEVIKLKVPVVVDVKSGTKWGKMIDLKNKIAKT